MCDKTLVYPLELIFKASIQERIFPGCWKKANVVPILAKYVYTTFVYLLSHYP